MLVSIVTPSFNHGQFIEATIGSVLVQDYPGLEYCVMDGASTDATVPILKRHGAKLKWISQPDKGQADAINQGMARCGGEILGWLNSDDLYAPGAIAAVAECFASRPDVGVVYGDAEFIGAAGNRIGRCQHVEPFNHRRLLHYSDYIVQPAAFFRRSLFEQLGGLDASLHWAMDYDFWLKAAEQTRFHYLPRVLAYYRWLDDSKTGSGSWLRLREVEQVARRRRARGLPAYFRLEAVRLRTMEALQAARRGRIDLAILRMAGAAAEALRSPRAIRSLLSLRTWRVISAGQTLRRNSGTHRVGG